MSQIISLSKTLKPTTQTQKPSHRIQNRQNNRKHITLISAKLKYIHSMYTYTQTEHKYTYRSNGLKSKINSTDQISSEDQTVHRKNPTTKKIIKSKSS